MDLYLTSTWLQSPLRWIASSSLADPVLAGIVLLGLLLLFAVVLEREPEARPRRAWRKPAAAEGAVRTLIVGAGRVGRMLAEGLEAGGRHQVVGFVDDRADPGEGRWPVLGPREQTSALVERLGVDEVYVAYAPTWQQELSAELSARCPNVRLSVVPTSFEALLPLPRVRNVGDVAVVQLAEAARPPGQRVKRVLDVAVSAAALLLLSPALLLIALIVRLSSPGPVLFAQERVGRYGVPFLLYKFRTMVQDAETKTGPVLSSGMNDERLTAAGRWLKRLRLDELPQLWNVLRGEMSLVGPRPERPCFVEEYEREIPDYWRRHLVRPGITGLAQVRAGYHTHAREKLRFDLIYLSNQSPWFDLTIMVRTVAVMLFG
ncbi:MAG: exopolysaccharide biosynthesis polyprenyl glycosylphosphotransferase [Armatimonadota bacterium]